MNKDSTIVGTTIECVEASGIKRNDVAQKALTIKGAKHADTE